MSEGTLVAGRYALGPVLGSGAFGRVHRAQHRVLGIDLRPVAVKLFSPTANPSPRRLLHDALEIVSILESCPDPVVRDRFVACFDAGLAAELDHRPYVVMELAPANLARRIGGRPLPVGEALEHAAEITRAVAYLHSIGHLHRDLKPDNVLLTAAGRTKLADFGLATAVDRLLREAPAAGTLAYQAPESLALERATPASDVYAIGLILFELLTGTLPYPDDVLRRRSVDRGALLELKLAAPEPPSRKLNIELREHPELESVLLGCLEPTGARYPDAGELLSALELAGQGRLPPRPPAGSVWDEIELLVERAEHALRRGDPVGAGGLIERAKALNDDLPGNATVTKVYPVLVKVALAARREDDAIRLAQQGLAAQACPDTFAAAALAYQRRSPDVAATFARRAGLEPR